MRKVIGLIAAAFVLSAGSCSHVDVAKPDPSKLVCAAEPDVPMGQGPAGEITDEQDAAYKFELRQSWFSCHSAVEWLHDWFEKLPD